MSSLITVRSEQELQALAYNKESRLAVHLEVRTPLSHQTIQAVLHALSTKELVDIKINDIGFFKRYDDVIVLEAESDLCECDRCIQPLPSLWSLVPQDQILDPLLDMLGLDEVPMLVERV